MKSFEQRLTDQEQRIESLEAKAGIVPEPKRRYQLIIFNDDLIASTTGLLTRAEVLEYLEEGENNDYWERPENRIQTRYDWSKAPAEARYWTTDKSGRQDWWPTKPVYFESEGTWEPDELGILGRANFINTSPCPDAASSLEARPE